MSEALKAPKEYHIDDQLRRKAEAIALFMGGDYNMTVGVGPWGSGWHWDFVRNHVNMDAKDLATEPEEIIKGVAAHEGNHRSVTRADHVQDMWQQPGFSFAFNAVEDPRANEGGMHFRPGSRDWIKAYIERDLGPGGGLNYQGIEKDAKDSIGYVPKFMQCGGEMIRYWYEKELNGTIRTKKDMEQFLKEIPDPDVRKTVSQTIPSFEKYYKTLPDFKDENEVQRKAKESSDDFRNNIWPTYKGLVDKSYKDHSLVKMVEDMLSQDSNQQGAGQGIKIPFSSLPKDVRDEIKQKIKDAQKQSKGKDEESEGKSGEDEKGNKGDQDKQKAGDKGGQKGEQRSAGRQSEDTKVEDEKSGKKQKDSDIGNGQKSGQGSDSGDKQQEEDKPGETKTEQPNEKVPWDKLSDKTKKEVEKAFDKLPEDGKDKYREAAKKELENVEDAANEKLRGKMSDPRKTKTHKEQREEDIKRQEDADKEAIADKIAREMDRKRKEALSQLAEDSYYQYLRLPEVDEIKRRQERELKKLFEPTEDPDIRHRSSGLRPSMGKAMQMESNRKITNIFESKGRPMDKKYRFLILVDLSPSMMDNDKITETFKLLVAFIENMNRFGLEFAIVGFHDGFNNNIKVYKDFDLRKITDRNRHKIGEMLNDVHLGQTTPTKEATSESYKLIRQANRRRAMEHNYFITFTDGEPRTSTMEDLLRFLKEIRKDKSIVTAGFGIGTGTQFVDSSYPQLPNEVKTAIARKLGKKVDDIGNSFTNAVEFGMIFDIIVGYMVKRPELFFR